MTSRIAPDNYDGMNIDQLKELLASKQRLINSLLHIDQVEGTQKSLREKDRVRHEEEVAKLKGKLRAETETVEALVVERNTAQHLAALLHERLLSFAQLQRRPKEIKDFVGLYHSALDQIVTLTRMPEQPEILFAQIFAAAEERVFGTKKSKTPVLDASEFVSRSLRKKVVPPDAHPEVPPGPPNPPVPPGPRPVG